MCLRWRLKFSHLRLNFSPTMRKPVKKYWEAVPKAAIVHDLGSPFCPRSWSIRRHFWHVQIERIHGSGITVHRSAISHTPSSVPFALSSSLLHYEERHSGVNTLKKGFSWCCDEPGEINTLLTEYPNSLVADGILNKIIDLKLSENRALIPRKHHRSSTSIRFDWGHSFTIAIDIAQLIGAKRSAHKGYSNSSYTDYGSNPRSKSGWVVACQRTAIGWIHVHHDIGQRLRVWGAVANSWHATTPLIHARTSRGHTFAIKWQACLNALRLK